MHSEFIPHVTLVGGLEEDALAPTLASLRRLVEPLLPLRFTPEHVTVLAEQTDAR
jgi:hypothetical protein